MCCAWFAAMPAKGGRPLFLGNGRSVMGGSHVYIRTLLLEGVIRNQPIHQCYIQTIYFRYPPSRFRRRLLPCYCPTWCRAVPGACVEDSVCTSGCCLIHASPSICFSKYTRWKFPQCRSLYVEWELWACVEVAWYEEIYTLPNYYYGFLFRVSVSVRK